MTGLPSLLQQRLEMASSASPGLLERFLTRWVLQRPHNSALLFRGLCFGECTSYTFNTLLAQLLLLLRSLRKGLCCGKQADETNPSQQNRRAILRRTSQTHKNKRARRKALHGKRREEKPRRERRSSWDASVVQTLSPARPGQGRGSRLRACSPASPGRWAEKCRARRSTWPITCLCCLPRGPAPPSPLRGVSTPRARAQSDHSLALGDAKLRASVLPANRTSLPPPLRPRPRSGRAHGRGCAGILRTGNNGGR